MSNWLKYVNLGSALCIAAFISACGANRQMVVRSEPANADVYIKGFNSEYLPKQKAKIGTTPYESKQFSFTDENGSVRTVKFEDLDDSKFFIIIEKDMYEATAMEAPPYAHELKLKPVPGADIAKRVISTIEESGDMGSVRITSTPSGAKVYLNAELVGNTPYTLEQKPGKYELKIQQVQHNSIEEKITIEGKKSKSVHFELEPNERATKISQEKNNEAQSNRKTASQE